MSGIHSLSELMVRQQGDQPVVSGLFGEVSARQFRDDVAALSIVLHENPCRRWALCLRDSYHFAVAFLASAHAGCELVLPGNLQPDALKEISGGFEGIIEDGEITDGLKHERIRLPLKSDGVSSTFEFQPLELDTTYLTLYTSGSSGVPKPIQKSLALLDAEIQTLETLWGDVLVGSCMAGTVSHQHIYGLLFRVLWPLCSGRPFERRMREHPEQVMDHGGAEITLISSPALLKRLDKTGVPTPFRAVFSSGGALPFPTSKSCETLLQTLPIEVFGSTETGGIAFRQSTAIDTPWELFPPIEMKKNAAGCLCLRSPFVPGDDWEETADRCRPLSERTFLLEGRADRIVKIEEKRISLPEVEHHVAALEWITDAVVIPLEQKGRQILCAVITLSKAGHRKIDDVGRGCFWILLRTELRRSVEPVGIPRRYRVVDHIPVNPQGKHSLVELKALFGNTMKYKPTILSQESGDNSVQLKLRIDEDIAYFEGHFSIFKLLPGVTQIDWAVYYGRELLGTPPIFQGMEVIKFFKPIRPGDIVELMLKWNPEKQKLQFAYSSEEGKHSSGRIRLALEE